MNKEEINGLLSEYKDSFGELVENAIGTLINDPTATGKLIIQIREMPMIIRDGYYWNKFYMFVTGVRKIEEDFCESVKLSDKLFGNQKDKEKNGMRLLGYIDKADSQQKVNYYINATRSLLLGLVDNTSYFRIMKAISETLIEDLEYLAGIIEKTDDIKGNIQLLALERSGLVIQAGIDANEDIESQSYVVSSLGKIVDKHAISLENEERMIYYRNVEQRKLEVALPTILSEEIDEIFK